MAAKGEQVDLKELARNKHASSDAQALKDDQKALPVNGAPNATTKQSQTVAGAVPAQNPTTTAPSASTAQATPATVTGAPVMGTAVPQALLNTGTFQSNFILSENG
jgi:molybdopterin-biosynthesis enzyme MoeA-like protein